MTCTSQDRTYAMAKVIPERACSVSPSRTPLRTSARLTIEGATHRPSVTRAKSRFRCSGEELFAPVAYKHTAVDAEINATRAHAHSARVAGNGTYVYTHESSIQLVLSRQSIPTLRAHDRKFVARPFSLSSRSYRLIRHTFRRSSNNSRKRRVNVRAETRF